MLIVVVGPARHGIADGERGLLRRGELVSLEDDVARQLLLEIRHAVIHDRNHLVDRGSLRSLLGEGAIQPLTG